MATEKSTATPEVEVVNESANSQIESGQQQECVVAENENPTEEPTEQAVSVSEQEDSATT